MLSSFLTVLGLKMVFYTVVLAVVCQRWAAASSRAKKAAKERDEAEESVQSLQAQLLNMGAQVNDWKAKGAAAASNANAAQLEAAELRREMEAKATEALLAPVPDDQAMAFLRREAKP